MQQTLPLLVYRDRIGVPSEIEFLRRQYIGFTQFHPFWVGRTLLPGAARIGPHRMRLGGTGLAGPAIRLLFRHFGLPPLTGFPSAAPVLHAQFARGGALALPLAHGLGLRLVVTLHGGDVSKEKNWHGTLLSRRWPALLRTTQRFVCVSGSVAENAIARGVSPDRLTVLPIGVEVADHPPARNPAAHLFVGRFVEKKGITVLAEAMRTLRAQGDPTPLVCVGDGTLRPLLESLAREVPGITLTGWLSAEAVRQRMAGARSLVVPSIIARDGDAEGLPSVIPEAMAQGCPVIGADQGGIAEAIRHGHTGLLVPPGDPMALAAAMRRITTDPSLGAALGLAGFTEARARFNALVQSQRLETLLLSVQ